MDTQVAAKHSGIGIASFIISVLSLTALIAVFVIIAIAVTSGGFKKGSIEMGAGLALVLTWLLTLIGLGLGIAGALVKNTKKVFSVLGIVFSASTIIISVAVVVLGLVVK